LGRSRGGLTTKIHLLADALGRPLRLILTPGQAADIKSAPVLLEGMSARGVIADKGYDSNALRALISEAGMAVVIPSNRTRKVLIPYDTDLYKTRNRIERCFNKLKHFRRIATRFDRRDIHFMAFLYLASFLIWMR
jgi:transposase